MTTTTEITCLNHGFVALVDTMGDDRTAARCARTSFHNQDAPRTVEDDQRLTRYLVKHRHTTPLEFCQLRFYMKMPIFVARQLIRHRTASVNELSLRYVQATEEFYVPDAARCQRQSTTNKQGSATELVDDPGAVMLAVAAAGEAAFAAYRGLLDLGLAKELARTVLPLGTYTEWYWQTDLHNFLHMLRLRLDPHAQAEIRVYAQAMLRLARPAFPTTIAAWEAEARPMFMWSNDHDHVIAADLDDVRDVVENKYGCTFEDEGWSLDDWAQVPGDKVITVNTLDGPGGDTRETKTAGEWITAHGRGHLCSQDY